MDFDTRTEKEKKKDARYFAKVRDIACNLIVFAYHENHADVNAAIDLLVSNKNSI